MKKITAGLDYIFQKIAAGKPDDLSLTQGSRRQEAREWFRSQAGAVQNVDAARMVNRSDRSRFTTFLQPQNIGQMFTYWYYAKHANELPYWDRLPLIFVVDLYEDGFLGINLHYLPPQMRAQLMDAIYKLQNNQRYDKSTRLLMSYQLLKSAAKYRYFKPCVKRYLHSHVQSQFIRIDPTEWDIALMLPTERFVKARKQRVWAESVAKLRSKGSL
jgi:hypothetical protein